MNIYEKLAEARAMFKSRNIKMSGNNTYVGYTYFDLSDILPATTEIEKELKMLSAVVFDREMATLTIYNAEDPKDYIVFTSPMSTAELKGCHAVQNLGAVETYIRRYLYLTAYEIVEVETLDKTHGKPDSKEIQKTNSKPLGNPEDYIVSFGKNIGKKLSELSIKAVEWYSINSKDEGLKEACKKVFETRNTAKNKQSVEDIVNSEPIEEDDEMPF